MTRRPRAAHVAPEPPIRAAHWQATLAAVIGLAATAASLAGWL